MDAHEIEQRVRDEIATQLEQSAAKWLDSASKTKSGDNGHLISTKCVARAEELKRWARLIRAGAGPVYPANRNTNPDNVTEGADGGR